MESLICTIRNAFVCYLPRHTKNYDGTRYQIYSTRWRAAPILAGQMACISVPNYLYYMSYLVLTNRTLLSCLILERETSWLGEMLLY